MAGHWTLQLSGRVDVDTETEDVKVVNRALTERNGKEVVDQVVTETRITHRYSDDEVTEREAALIERLREIVAELGCDYARLCTGKHGTIDLV